MSAATPLSQGRMTPGAPLFVVAAESEAASFDPELPLLITGIGKIAAACALTECLAHYAVAGGLPSVVVNIGTAGALRAELEGTHIIKSVLLHDFSHASVARIVGYDVYPSLDLSRDSVAAEHSQIVLATGDAFIDSAATRKRLAEFADLVDMEGYAVAHTARRFGVPVELIKHVSDTADEDAAQRWVRDMPAIAVNLAEQARRRP